MSDDYKTCKNCKTKVGITANYCPNCKSTSFRENSKIKTIIHALFYTKHDNYFILSKTKLFTIICYILVFIEFLADSSFLDALIESAIVTVPVCLAGFVLHRALGNDNLNQNVIKNNDYGLFKDICHLSFYWQNKKNGNFRFSITKFVFIVVFLFFLILCFIDDSDFIVNIIMALIFSSPVFFIGLAIHRLKDNETSNKIDENHSRDETKENSINNTEFNEYKIQLNELKQEYDFKEKALKDLIEKQFTPPQLTYTHFISVIDESRKIFNNQYYSLLNIFNLASRDSERIDSEIDKKFDVIRQLIAKLDDLIDEFVIYESKTDDSNLNNLIGEMNNLIESVKDYE